MAAHWLTACQLWFAEISAFFSGGADFFKLREAVTLQLLIGFGSSDTLGLCTPRDLLISEVFCPKYYKKFIPHWW